MSKSGFETGKYPISFGDEMRQNELFVDDDDENFDAFNDETFGGDVDESGDWESEHEKLSGIASSKHNDGHAHRSLTNKDVTRNDPHLDIHHHQHYEYLNESDAFDFHDIVEKTISNLVLEDDDDFNDDDLNDPAIMTVARGMQRKVPSIPLNKPLPPSSSSPPPPAFLDFEEYSASPKTTTIWSTSVEPKVSPPQSLITNTSSVKMRTLQDIEEDMLNRNNEQMFSTIKRPIKAEELEASLLNNASSINRNETHQLSSINSDNQSDGGGWNPFGGGALLPEILPNGRIQNDKTSSPEKSSDRVSSPIITSGTRNVEDLEKSILMKPQIMKAQTLDEIERQFASSSSSGANANAKPQYPQQRPHHPLHYPPRGVPQMMMRPSMPNLFPPQIQNHLRPHIVQQRALLNRGQFIPMIPGMSQPPIGRGFYPHPLIPGSQRLYPIPIPSRPHPFLQKQMQAQLMQQQLHYQQQYFQNNRQNFMRHQHQRNVSECSDNDDEYAGLMTQRDKEWLIRIQQMQTELKDPYKDDYYYVTHMSRKIAAAAAEDKDGKSAPSLLLPERPKPAADPSNNGSKYVPIQFEGSLGKIQVSNVNCPRKLLDCGVNKQSNIECLLLGDLIDNKFTSKGEVSKFRKLLLEIERLYLVLLNIDDEDKRINALPEEARKPHHDTRRQHCEKLFKGLTNESQEKINLDVVQIKKGLALLFRSLSYLSDVNNRSVIITDLMNATNFRQYVVKPKDRLDYGRMLINAIYNINDPKVLVNIVKGINDIPAIIKSECGQKVIESIMNQFEKLEINDKEIRTNWTIFVNHVLDDADDIPQLRKFCSNHLQKLGL